MATLVLTTIGTIVGGPIGGAIGAVLGQQVDQRLFAPKGRQGARLGELTVQTSSYGTPIAKLFGTMRVAGTVIWATDLRETADSSGGGKGRPKVTNYSYSASFAVALSGRPIRAVHRIWADGKLLRGAAGDWKSATGFRLYLGDEAQEVDPLIAAAEGGGREPGVPRIAYAVFEDMQLADYGNHIPSLTFEVEADAGPVAVGAIAEALSDGAAGGATTAALDGYAAGGDSVRGAIEGLARVITLSVRDDGEALVLSDAPGAAIAIGADELGTSETDKRVERREIERQAAGTLPDEVSIAYYEPARDYQAGLQRARRSGGPARVAEMIELAAAIDAGEAKAVAERRLADIWAARARTTARLRWQRLDLRPGDALVVDGIEGVQRVTGWTLEHMVLELKLAGVAAARVAAAGATPGRVTGEADALPGASVIALLDLPPLDDAAETVPRMWVAAAGTAPGWRRAALITSLDGGASWQEAGSTAAPAVIGSAIGALGSGDAALIDRVNSVDVVLLHDGMWLQGRDDDALAGGANLAMLGDELIQFGVAEPLGANRFRLSRLLRGRRGTEWAAGGHAAGERFVLIERVALLALDMPGAMIGADLRVVATGIGDAVPAEATATVLGRALRPPAPVRLSAVRQGDGTIRLAWVRRSRIGWAWRDGGDVPLGEEAERYRLEIATAAGVVRTIESAAPAYDYGVAEQAADGVGGAALTVSVAQSGSLGASLPAAIATFTV